MLLPDTVGASQGGKNDTAGEICDRASIREGAAYVERGHVPAREGRHDQVYK